MDLRLFDSLPDAVIVTDGLGNIAYLNGVAQRLFGVVAEDVIGRSIEQFMPPWSHEELTRTSARLLSANEPGSIAEPAEMACLRADGAQFPVEISLRRLEEEQAPFVVAVLRDITTRKQVEGALRRSVDLLGRTEQVAKVGGWELDLDTQTLTWTDGAYRVHEVDPAITPTVADVIQSYAPEARPVIIAAMQAAIDAGTPFNLELPLTTARGRHIWVRTRGEAERRGGKTTRLHGACQDITERMRGQEAEARLAAILDATPDLVGIADLEGRLIYVNRAGRRMVGIPELADLAGYNLQTFHDPAHAHIVLTEGIPRAMQDGAWSGESGLVALDGHRIAVSQVILAHKAPDGSVAFLSTIARDITERTQEEERILLLLSDVDESRKRVETQAMEIAAQAEILKVNEQRLSLILTSTRDAYWDWDMSRGQIDVNSQFARALGWDEGKPHPLEAFIHRVHESDRAVAKKGVDRVARGEAKQILHEFRLLLADGQCPWVQVKGEVVSQDDQGRPLRATGMLSNINDRKLREEEHQRAQRLEAVGGLAAGVAHEINTPLQFVGDNLDFLSAHCHKVMKVLDLMDCLQQRMNASPLWRILAGDLLVAAEEADLTYITEQFPAAISESVEGIERVRQIVRALKEFAHPGDSERGLVDMNHLVENAITLTRNEWKYVAEVETVLDASLPLLHCAPGDCTQLLVNLIVNAAHAIADRAQDRQKGRITVRTRLSDGNLEIQVADTGSGIPLEIRDRIFDPFFTTKAIGKGTGQGLALAHAIVDRHGGAISFESEIGQGTTFYMRLPMGPGARAA